MMLRAARSFVPLCAAVTVAVALAGCGGAPRARTSPAVATGSSTAVAPPASQVPGAAVPAGLWVSDINANVVTDFHAPPASTPTTVVAKGLTHPEALAFDSRGNLWVGDGGPSPAILEFAAGGLAAGSGPAAVIDTRGTSPEGLAFDSAGNLWVAAGTALVEFGAGALGHNPSPSKVITSSVLDGPCSLAFDPLGRSLWVANFNNRVLLEYPARSLSAAHPEPGLHIQLPGGTAPFGIAFDSKGDLWVPGQNDTVDEYAARTLGTTSTPSATIDMSTLISGGALSLAFDSPGDLWVSAIGSGSSGAPEGMVYEYAARTLGTTSTPSARLVASTSSNPGTWALAFYPVPASLGPR